MTREEFHRIMLHSIDKTMEDNYDRIGLSLVRGVEENDDLLSMETKMIRNAIGVSCQISLQLIGDMMEQAGLIAFEEPREAERRPNLRVITPSRHQEEPEDE